MSGAVSVFLYRYGDIALLDNYVKALTATGMEPVVSTDPNASSECGALLLPGGCDSDPSFYGQENTHCRRIDIDRDRVEIELTRRFCAAKKPILAVCRGHQLLNFFFGGDLIQDIAEKERHDGRSDGTDALHGTTILPGSFLAPLYGGAAVVTSSHHQAVGRLAPVLRAVQWAPDGIVEGLEHESLPIWGVQWHPERQAFTRRREGAADGARLFDAWHALCRAQ